MLRKYNKIVGAMRLLQLRNRDQNLIRGKGPLTQHGLTLLLCPCLLGVFGHVQQTLADPAASQVSHEAPGNANICPSSHFFFFFIHQACAG